MTSHIVTLIIGLMIGFGGSVILAREATRVKSARRVAWSNEERALQLVAKFETERAKVKRLELRLRKARAINLYLKILERAEWDDESFRHRWEKRAERVLVILGKTLGELANVDR